MTGRILIAAGLCLCAGLYGYHRGAEVAETRGRAALAEQAASVSRDREAATLAAEAERAVRLRLERESARAVALAAEMEESRKRLAAQRRIFNRRMARVAQDARNCAGLSDDWVRLYNEALGLVPSCVAAGEPSLAAGTAPAARTASAAGAELRSGTSVEDLLAPVRDYGGYCRSLRAQAEALVAVERGRTETP